MFLMLFNGVMVQFGRIYAQGVYGPGSNPGNPILEILVIQLNFLYEFYKKLKSTLNIYKIEGMYCHIDDASSEIEEFKRKYLLVVNKE